MCSCLCIPAYQHSYCTFTGPLLNTCLVVVNVNHCFTEGFPEAAESARLTQQLWAREAHKQCFRCVFLLS